MRCLLHLLTTRQPSGAERAGRRAAVAVIASRATCATSLKRFASMLGAQLLAAALLRRARRLSVARFQQPLATLRPAAPADALHGSPPAMMQQQFLFPASAAAARSFAVSRHAAGDLCRAPLAFTLPAQTACPALFA